MAQKVGGGMGWCRDGRIKKKSQVKMTRLTLSAGGGGRGGERRKKQEKKKRRKGKELVPNCS